MSSSQKRLSIDKRIYLCLAALSYLIPAATLAAAEQPKRTLKDNMEEGRTRAARW